MEVNIKYVVYFVLVLVLLAFHLTMRELKEDKLKTHKGELEAIKKELIKERLKNDLTNKKK